MPANQSVSFKVPNSTNVIVKANEEPLTPGNNGEYTFIVRDKTTVTVATKEPSTDIWEPVGSGYRLNENAAIPQRLDVPASTEFTIYTIATDTKVQDVTEVIIGSGSQLNIERAKFNRNVDFTVDGALALYNGAVFNGTVKIHAPESQTAVFAVGNGDRTVVLNGGIFNQELVLEDVAATVASNAKVFAQDITLNAGSSLKIASGATLSANITVNSEASLTLDAGSTIQGSVSNNGGSVDNNGGTIDNGNSNGGSTGGGGSSSNTGTRYSISVESGKNGKVSVSPKSAEKGSPVTITVTPDEGYELDTLTVVDSQKNDIDYEEKSENKFTFKMPSSRVTVSATFTAIEDTANVNGVNPVPVGFADVTNNAYYYDAVRWAVENGITEGTSASTFSPNMTCSRAQVVTFLWRAQGSPEPKSTVNKFTDVSASDYYYKAVLWAVENGITEGTSATTFSPSASCTRGQVVTFLWRAQSSPSVSGGQSFSDVSNSTYYYTPVLWAVQNNITAGMSANTFAPNSACTRAQIVTFLYRALAK